MFATTFTTTAGIRAPISAISSAIHINSRRRRINSTLNARRHLVRPPTVRRRRRTGPSRRVRFRLRLQHTGLPHRLRRIGPFRHVRFRRLLRLIRTVPHRRFPSPPSQRRSPNAAIVTTNATSSSNNHSVAAVAPRLRLFLSKRRPETGGVYFLPATFSTAAMNAPGPPG